jgi:hypothetical protein
VNDKMPHNLCSGSMPASLLKAGYGTTGFAFATSILASGFSPTVVLAFDLLYRSPPTTELRLYQTVATLCF